MTASNDFSLKLWDIKSEKEKVKFEGHTSAVNHVSYSVSIEMDPQLIDKEY